MARSRVAASIPSGTASVGGGIGLEATRSLLWLAACVVVAEIDEAAGRQAEARLCPA